MPKALVRTALEDIGMRRDDAIPTVEAGLPAGFPEAIHAAVKDGMIARMRVVEAGLRDQSDDMATASRNCDTQGMPRHFHLSPYVP